MPEPIISTSFCPVPWRSIASTADGKLTVCCRASNLSGEITTQRLKGMSLEDIWNAPIYGAFRQKLLAGEKLSACQTCYREESLGVDSKRTIALRKLQGMMTKADFGKWYASLADGGQASSRPTDATVRFGNICNFSCRMCSPKFSSEVAKNIRLLSERGKELPGFLSRFEGFSQDPSWQISFINAVCEAAPFLNSLYFVGAEPLISPAYRKLTERLLEMNVSGKIHLCVNTNASKLNEFWRESLSRFQSVEIIASIDGIGKSQEYLREGSIWNTTIETLKKFAQIPTVNQIDIFTTLSIYNIRVVPELLRWFIVFRKEHGPKFGFKVNFLNDPDILSAKQMPRQFADSLLVELSEIQKQEAYFQIGEGLRAMERILSLLRKCGAKLDPNKIRELRSFTTVFDEHFDKSLAAWIPEAHEIFESYESFS